MKSPIAKRSIMIDGHKTGVSLEDAFWTALKEISKQTNETLSQLVGAIDRDRAQGNLSSATRLFVLARYQGEAIRRQGSTEVIGARAAA